MNKQYLQMLLDKGYEKIRHILDYPLATLDFNPETTFISSDLHLGHGRIIEYCARPFKDVEAMNQVIIQNHVNALKDAETYICLGDVLFKDFSNFEWFKTLACRKILVLGNHDLAPKKMDILKDIFPEIYSLVVIPDNKVVLSHLPFGSYREPGYINIHGHIHNGVFVELNDGYHRNVSVEVINYTPISLKEVLEEDEAE